VLPQPGSTKELKLMKEGLRLPWPASASFRHHRAWFRSVAASSRDHSFQDPKYMRIAETGLLQRQEGVDARP
jgi:hypothetical protein